MYFDGRSSRRQFVGLVGSAAATLPLMAPSSVFAKVEMDPGGRRRINVSGRQRMLSQRMSRAVLFMALAVEPERHLEMLGLAHTEFDRALEGLRHGNDEMGLPRERYALVLAEIDVVDQIWAEFGARIQSILTRGKPTDADVEAVASDNMRLLDHSNRVVDAMVEQHGRSDMHPGLAISINIAGRQRMLSQKMAKESALVGLGYQVEATCDTLEGTAQLFDASLVALMDGLPEVTLPKPPQNVHAKLSEVRGIWKDYRGIVGAVAATGTAQSDALAEIAATADPLLKTMNDAVTLYEQI